VSGIRLAAVVAACWLASVSGAAADARLAAANDWLYVLQPMAGATLADIIDALPPAVRNAGLQAPAEGLP